MKALVEGVIFALVLVLGSVVVFAQDSVDVTFRYNAPGRTSVSVPGEFNGWSPESGRMTNVGGDLWLRTVRLAVGGNPNPPAVGVPNAWQYKFWYDGVSDWPNDPLNHHMNPLDNNNSFLYVKDPTIYQFIPNQRLPVVSTSTPVVSAYIFPKVGSVVDTSSIQLVVDGTAYGGLGSFYNFTTQQLSVAVPPLSNGTHTAILRAGTNSDTVTFTSRGGYVQIYTQGGYSTRASVRSIRGSVGNPLVSSVKVVWNDTDTTEVGVSNRTYGTNVTLAEGFNTFKTLADSNGTLVSSTSVTFTYIVDHTPTARATALSATPTAVQLSAVGSTDPDSQPLTFKWFDDPRSPLGLTGLTGSVVMVSRPTVRGEYFYGLIATDPDGGSDTTLSYFTIRSDGSFESTTIAGNPEWAKKARVYFLFPKAASQAGTINAAAARLQYIKDLGFNVIWVMPVMKNAYPIDLNFGPGYNIVDFYNVAPEYGTNDDFKNFVSQAHGLRLKVILDVTPNHTSRFHPWSADAHTFNEDSRWWSWYEHTIISHNDNGLGQSLDGDGFNYYSGFSSQLLNFNWRDVDARTEMINVYKYWITQFGLDGYRFDVYWGPHRRYGEQYMGKPVRDALKHIKPDILLLGEDDGTGAGTETIYADYVSGGINGGLDASYDFKLYFNQIRSFQFTPGAITSLHNEIDNGAFYPGRDALYMRFMESQDEDRIVYFYSNNFSIEPITTFMRTMPMASVIFTAPGYPMIWNGQEVGWGYGIQGAKERRNRSVIDWNYQGKNLLSPHYQKLAHIRAQFPAFTQHKEDTNADGQINVGDVPDFVRAGSTNDIIYAFARPYLNQNGLTVVNFSGSDQSTTINLTGANILMFTGGIQPGTQYYLNDLYNKSNIRVAGSALDSVSVTLPPYGTSIFSVSTTFDTLTTDYPVLDVKEQQAIPSTYDLAQNYPNPFNPSTMIRFQVPQSSRVSIKIYDMLGREVTTLADAEYTAGLHEVNWGGRTSSGSPVSSGVYLYRLYAIGSSGHGAVISKKLVLMK